MFQAKTGGRMENKKYGHINLNFAILLFTVFAYFILGEMFLPSDESENNYLCFEYSGRWERILSDGTREPTIEEILGGDRRCEERVPVYIESSWHSC